MTASEKSKIRNAIEFFYVQNTSKTRKSDTWHEFKNKLVSKVNGKPNYTRRTCRIKKCIKEINMEMVIKMFDNLKPKIIQAKDHGLESLIYRVSHALWLF